MSTGVPSAVFPKETPLYSIAGLLLTTEAMIAELPEEKKAPLAQGMSDMGGMHSHR